MAPGNHDFRVYKNNTFQTEVNISEADTGEKVDLTGYSAEMDVRPQSTSATETITLTEANGRLTITPGQGKIELKIDSSDVNSIDSGRYVYDLRIEDSSGNSELVIRGDFVVEESVTR